MWGFAEVFQVVGGIESARKPWGFHAAATASQHALPRVRDLIGLTARFESVSSLKLSSEEESAEVRVRRVPAPLADIRFSDGNRAMVFNNPPYGERLRARAVGPRGDESGAATPVRAESGCARDWRPLESQLGFQQIAYQGRRRSPGRALPLHAFMQTVVLRSASSSRSRKPPFGATIVSSSGAESSGR